MPNKILIIGNSGRKSNGNDGQTVKVRQYLKAFDVEKIDYIFVDLENGLRHLFRITNSIKKGIKNCDRVVLLTASRGVKFFIPLINHYNKQKKSFILPMIGCNILDKYLSKLNEADYQKVFKLEKALKITKRDMKNVSKINCVLAENKSLAALVASCFPNSHVEVLDNFRFVNKKYDSHFNNDTKLSLVFVSRVCEEKGILDLMEVVNDLTKVNKEISLDIYGKISLDNNQHKHFDNLIENCPQLSYCGEVSQEKATDVLHKYDLFVFPTKYKGEGTPGVLAESLISGTPILSSSFSNASNILSFGSDSISYAFGNKNDLKEKIVYLHNNKFLLKKLSKNCIKNSNKFIYSAIRDDFLKFVCGK